ncbi:MAG TPA: hypothetical protein DG753_01805 [Clostridium sp.]|nr:hypothetical protein [Clostridium sp.]
MSCRCTDKANCRKDINTIEQILYTLIDSERTNSELYNQHSDLSSSSRETFTTINMNELNMEELQLNKDVSEIIPDLIIKCKKKLKELEREYSSLKSEDNRYHERKRHHHHSH